MIKNNAIAVQVRAIEQARATINNCHRLSNDNTSDQAVDFLSNEIALRKFEIGLRTNFINILENLVDE